MTTTKTKLTDWFTQDIFDTIFPYADCSALYCSDDKPFYTYQDFIAGIEWLDAHKNESFHGFCQSDNLKNSKLEMAAFLANAQQEVGDPSLLAPYPWLPTTATATTTKLVGAGKAGGLLSVVEGLSPSVVVHAKGTPNPFKKQAILSTTRTSLRPVAQKLIGLDNDSVISCCVLADTSFQKQFGLAKGQGAGVVFQPGLCAVDDNGNLYGDESKSTNAADTVLPVSSIPLQKPCYILILLSMSAII